MDKHLFKTTVYNWLNSCQHVETVENLRPFVYNHAMLPPDVKAELCREMDNRIAAIKEHKHPVFVPYKEHQCLADDEGKAKLFTTRFSALWKVYELKAKGFDAALLPGTAFYRIKLNANEAVTA